MNNYYIYLHIKNINGEPFYVGRGKNNRAYDFKKSRNNIWHNIYNKYGVDVIILENNLDIETANKLEKYWINRIGRRDLNTGTLINLTGGGDGCINVSEITKNKIRESLKGHTQTYETKQKRKNTLKNVWTDLNLIELKRKQTKKLWDDGIIKYNYDLVPNRKNAKLTQEQKNKVSNGLKDYFSKNISKNKKFYKIIQYDMYKNCIKIWESQHEAATELNLNVSCILDACRNKNNKNYYKNYIWEFYNK